jgi:hypothetical protein
MSGTDRALRVVLVSYHFPPFGSPGSLRVGAFARHLPGLGVDLDVVTTDEPRFPRIDAALAALLPREVAITRVGRPLSGVHWTARRSDRRAGTIVARALDRVARPDHAIAWSLRAGLAAGRIARNRGADVVLTSSPPHSTLLAGRIARSLAGPGVRWVADLRDPVDGGGGPVAAIPSRVLASADGVVCNTAAMEEAFRTERPDAVTATVPNGYDEEAIERARVAADGAPRRQDEIVLVHAGALYGGQRDPTGLIHALGRAQVDASRRVRFRLILAGADPARIPPELAGTIAQLPPPAVVELPGFLPHADMLRRMATADLLVLFQPAGFPLQIPSKAYEYLALGRRVLALGDVDGATADLVRRYSGGAVARHDDVGRIEAVLRGLVDDPPSGVASEVDPALVPGRRATAEHLAAFLRSIVAGR